MVKTLRARGGLVGKADSCDVVVVGAGNAALAAAVAARQAGAKRVVVLEKAPLEQRGGNTHYSGGIYRFAYDELAKLLPLLPADAPAEERNLEGFQTYLPADFRADLMRVTDGRTDPELSDLLISRSYDTVRWVAGLGVRIEFAAKTHNGVRRNLVKYSKGAVIRAEHHGVGLSKMWFDIAEGNGIEIRYESAATGLMVNAQGAVCGAEYRGSNGPQTLRAASVVLGAGGFESNPAWRAQYLGRPWDHAKVRGTAFNQGDGLRMAMDIGAMPFGNWTGCHATPIAADAPAYGDRKLTDRSNRVSYIYSVMLNTRGERFLDEGFEQQLHTYARYGGVILNQPGSLAFQIFDQKVVHLLEPRYSTSAPIVAQTLEDLVAQLPLNRGTAMRTLNEFNAAARDEHAFDPTRKDGLRTKGLPIDKTNWAQRLDTPPFVCYPATGGITFTFGGLKIDANARVIGTDWRPITGLYACGEMVGGLFHGNYPGGSGLTSGAVFGRIAGTAAAGA